MAKNSLFGHKKGNGFAYFKVEANSGGLFNFKKYPNFGDKLKLGQFF